MKTPSLFTNPSLSGLKLLHLVDHLGSLLISTGNLLFDFEIGGNPFSLLHQLGGGLCEAVTGISICNLSLQSVYDVSWSLFVCFHLSSFHYS